MNANSEELYLEAEAEIKNNHYAEAFKKIWKRHAVNERSSGGG
jgi:hypothetical protein